MICERTITIMKQSGMSVPTFAKCILPYQHPGQCADVRCPAVTGGGGAMWMCNQAYGHDGDHIGQRIDLESRVVTVLPEEEA